MPQTITLTQSIDFDELAQKTELAKIVQAHLIRLSLLDPPVDGKFGPFSKQALQEFQTLMELSEVGFGPETNRALESAKEVIPLQLGEDFGSRIIKYMKQSNYFVAVGKQQYNIVYVEGADPDGKPNADTFNQWNDRRLVIELVNGMPHIIGNWFATTEPGDAPTIHPQNPKGAARIAFGQYQAWQVGTHVGASGFDPHEALLQVADVSVYRDRNQDGVRTGDQIDVGQFGINQHWGYDTPSFVGGASAGCLVSQSRASHRDFMRLIKQDRRYQLNPGYLFFTTIIAGDELVKVTTT